MNTMITCPNCQSEIELTQAMESQLTPQIRADLEKDLAAARSVLQEREEALEEEVDRIEELEKSLEKQVNTRLAEREKELAAEAKTNASKEVALELQDHQEQLLETEEKLKEAQKNELNLRKRERQIKEQQEQAELEMARRLDTERDQIRSEAKRAADEEHQLNAAERDKKEQGLLDTIKELKRKAEQGPQNTQGEVLEMALENLLESSFRHDSIVPVPKGRAGADVLQRVGDLNGTPAGSILWESKRAKTWSNKWLPKLRDDQREAGAEFAVLVSEILPKEIQTFGRIDGVWVCRLDCALGLAYALRTVLTEVSKTRVTNDQHEDRLLMLHDYLGTPGFTHRIQGMVEAIMTMKTELDAEKRSTNRMWAKREKQLELAIKNTAGLYGDFQGIVGSALPTLEALELPRLTESTPDIESSNTTNN